LLETINFLAHTPFRSHQKVKILDRKVSDSEATKFSTITDWGQRKVLTGSAPLTQVGLISSQTMDRALRSVVCRMSQCRLS